MLITKEQQEAVLEKYAKRGKNQDECIAFIDGMEAMFRLILQIEIRETQEKIDNIKKP